jgi:hypothetical protein
MTNDAGINQWKPDWPFSETYHPGGDTILKDRIVKANAIASQMIFREYNSIFFSERDESTRKEYSVLS